VSNTAVLVDPGSLPRLPIHLEHGDTLNARCCMTVFDVFERFTAPSRYFPEYGAYEVNASVLVIPDDIERDWWGLHGSSEMRHKVRRATRLGYTFAPFDVNDHLDDIYAINTSMRERQGRAMDEEYTRRPDRRAAEELSCDRHREDWLGVFHDGTLYAYMNALQLGEMMYFSIILGHGDRLYDGIMHMLVYEAVKHNRTHYRADYAVYYLQDSGTEGLQLFKRKIGFSGFLVRYELR
jgi:hypothetical protein